MVQASQAYNGVVLTLEQIKKHGTNEVTIILVLKIKVWHCHLQLFIVGCSLYVRLFFNQQKLKSFTEDENFANDNLTVKPAKFTSLKNFYF